jgi:hypothetical protein
MNLVEQIYYMVKHMKFDYRSVQNMPIYERRIYLDMWQKEMEEEQKQYKKAQSKR